jgi:hypothetical protein
MLERSGLEEEVNCRQRWVAVQDVIRTILCQIPQSLALPAPENDPSWSRSPAATHTQAPAQSATPRHRFLRDAEELCGTS